MSNITPHITLFDKSFSEQKTVEYDLLIQVSKNDLKYALIDISEETFVGLEVYQFNDVYSDFSLVEPLQNVLKNNPLLKKEFNSIQISFINNRATLVPNAIFKSNELAAYHKFNFTQQDQDQFFNDTLINLSAHNIYAVPEFIINEFKFLDKVTIKHFSTSLIEAALLYAKTTNSLSLVDVHVLPDSFQIIVIKNQRLELYNSFEYQTSEDFIYYLLFVLDQLNINNEKASIRLLGEVEKDSAIYSILYKYVQTILFAKNSNNLKLSYIFEDIPEHIHYSLFNQFL